MLFEICVFLKSSNSADSFVINFFLFFFNQLWPFEVVNHHGINTKRYSVSFCIISLITGFQRWLNFLNMFMVINWTCRVLNSLNWSLCSESYPLSIPSSWQNAGMLQLNNNFFN